MIGLIVIYCDPS